MNHHIKYTEVGKITSVVLDNFELSQLIKEAVATKLGINLDREDVISIFYGDQDFTEFNSAATCLRFIEKEKLYE